MKALVGVFNQEKALRDYKTLIFSKVFFEASVEIIVHLNFDIDLPTHSWVRPRCWLEDAPLHGVQARGGGHDQDPRHRQRWHHAQGVSV